jgi:hypothetical protein
MRRVLSNRRREGAFTSVAIWSRNAPSATASNTGDAGIGERGENDTAGNSVIEDARTLPIAIPLNHQNHGVVAAETFGIAE